MKKLFTTLFALTLLSTLGTLQVSAQISAASGLSVSLSDAIFCAANSFKLTASAKDASNNSFSSYEWAEVNTAGGADVITAETDALLELTNVHPGYHTYRVKGLQSNVGGAGGPTCQSDDFDDFTVYVLPPLTVAASTTSAISRYCENAVPGTIPSTSDILLSSTVGIDISQQGTAPSGLTNPTLVTAFALKYQWYKTEVPSAANPAPTPVLITNATNSTYAIRETALGTFNYKCEVSYTVKDVCTYSGTVQSGSTDVQIVVTPKPGKPTITLTP